MTLLTVTPETQYQLVSKVGSIQLWHDCKGRTLEKELASATQEFVRAMELRGWTLASIPGLKNPVWVTDGDNQMVAYYAIDWLGERTGTKNAQARGESHQRTDFPTRPAHRGAMPTPREFDLEATDGMVEYRCVGVFWAPEAVIEILGDSYERKQKEQESKNPSIFGPSGNIIHKE